MNPYAGRRLPTTRSSTDRPRCLVHVHLYPPAHCAGAEMMAHALGRHLAAAGWDVEVAAQHERTPVFEFDGLRVWGGRRNLPQLYRWADVVVTHLDVTRQAAQLARTYGRALVHLVHNDRQLSTHRVRRQEAALVVANSEWIAGVLSRWPGPLEVLRPPVEYDAYRTTPGDRVTLVNLSEPKGAPLFYALAAACPHLEFLAVRGAYGVQVDPPRSLGNLEVVENTPAIVERVYARTRVLLMPSSYESWGRVAVEAMCSGIPVVAHPTPGLLESLSYAGTFVDRRDVSGWLEALDYLNGPAWEHASAQASRRAAELEALRLGDLERIERRFAQLAGAARRVAVRA